MELIIFLIWTLVGFGVVYWAFWYVGEPPEMPEHIISIAAAIFWPCVLLAVLIHGRGINKRKQV